MVGNNKTRRALIVCLIIAILAVIAVYYYGGESVPGAPLPDETTNIQPKVLQTE